MVAFYLKVPISPDDFLENAQVWSFFVRRHRGRRRKEKKVGRIGLRGNYYDADFFAFRTRIGSLKKTRQRKLPKKDTGKAGRAFRNTASNSKVINNPYDRIVASSVTGGKR